MYKIQKVLEVYLETIMVFKIVLKIEVLKFLYYLKLKFSENDFKALDQFIVFIEGILFLCRNF